MKRIILFLCLLLPLVSFSQDKYSVYKCVENVKIYDADSKGWDPVNKGCVLGVDDILDVPIKQGVHILEAGSNRIYSNVKIGEQTIKSIIEQSAKDASSTFKNLNRQIVKNASKLNKKNGYSIYGMTTRGLSDELNFVDSLYCSIYEAVRNMTTEESLSIRKIVNSDTTISFKIENNGDYTLYTSIVYGNMSHLSMCMEGEFVFPLLPHSVLDLTSLKFIEPSIDEDYYVIASEKVFDLSPIKTKLRYMREPNFSIETDLIKIAVVQ